MDDTRLPDGTPFAFWDDATAYAREWVVAADGPDDGDGSAERPFASINRALAAAGPGERVRVRPGTYRELVIPPRGGTGPEAMLHLAGEPGAVVSGAEVIAGGWEESRGWSRRGGDPALRIWSRRLPREWFVGVNPLTVSNRSVSNPLGGFIQSESPHQALLTRSCAMLFQDDRPLVQVNNYHELRAGDGRFWCDPDGLTVHLRPAGDGDPADHAFEITARAQGIAPDVEGLGWIRISGLVVERCANLFPYMPQQGAISTRRGHRWLIEDCTVRQVNAVGIDAGKRDARAENLAMEERHVMRRNHVHDCGICGIAGIGQTGTLIEDNLVERCATHDIEEMWESAGIKTHHNVDTLIRRNRVRDIPHGSGMWLDFANRNLRVTGNVISEVESCFGGIFVEASKVPNLVDRNLVYAVRAPAGREGGHGVYSHDTDYLRVERNACIDCAGSGVHLRKGEGARIADGRGSCSRRHRIRGNVLRRCRWQISLAHPDSESDGNCFDRPPGRHQASFRLLELDEHHDLGSWREFHGLDRGSVLHPLPLDFADDALVLGGDLPDSLAPLGPFPAWEPGARVPLDPRRPRGAPTALPRPGGDG